MMKIQIYLLIAIGVMLLLSGIGYITCFTVNEREYVILTEFGKTVEVLDEPGLYFKKPGFLQAVNRLDKRLHIFKSQPITLMTIDQHPIILACVICWKISDPVLFFQSLKDVKNANGKLSEMISDELGNVLADHTLENIINVDPDQVKLDYMETTVRGNTNTKAETKYGVHIARVGIRRMAYPANVEQSVYNRMEAEREKEAKKYRAEGQEEADKIMATTDKDVKKLMAEAYRDAQMTRGTADQEAMRIYAEAYGKDEEFYEFLKSLDIYKQTLQENTTLILSTESSLFKHLNYQAGSVKTKEKGEE